MTTGPRFRSKAFYRLVLVLPLVTLVGLLATGRLQTYWATLFWDHHPHKDAFASQFLTALLWMAAASPLLFAAWEIGSQHTAARRLELDLVSRPRWQARRCPHDRFFSGATGAPLSS